MGTKDVMIRMCQPHNTRGRQPLFERFCHCTLRREVTGIRLGALSWISNPTLVRKSVDGEDWNIDARILLPAGLNSILDCSDLAWSRRLQWRGIVGIKVSRIKVDQACDLLRMTGADGTELLPSERMSDQDRPVKLEFR